MENKKSMRKLSKNLEICQFCGLAVINCVCDEAPKIKTNLNFYIITSELELYRPSNSAKLLKFASPESVKIIKWERKNISPEISKILNSNEKNYLVYPLREGEKTVTEESVEVENNKKINLIILDGTWNETDKILRKSDYLKSLPRISIENAEKTDYKLRKGAGNGEICTIEVIIELLKKYDEYNNAESLKEYFKLFKSRFYATVCGHKDNKM